MANFTHKETKLFQILKSLKSKLRKDTLNKYKRINPFMEDISSWQDEARDWQASENVTIYDSTTIVGDVTIGENTWILKL